LNKFCFIANIYLWLYYIIIMLNIRSCLNVFANLLLVMKRQPRLVAWEKINHEICDYKLFICNCLRFNHLTEKESV
jgi:hypothetical protein